MSPARPCPAPLHRALPPGPRRGVPLAAVPVVLPPRPPPLSLPCAPRLGGVPAPGGAVVGRGHCASRPRLSRRLSARPRPCAGCSRLAPARRAPWPALPPSASAHRSAGPRWLLASVPPRVPGLLVPPAPGPVAAAAFSWARARAPRAWSPASARAGASVPPWCGGVSRPPASLALCPPWVAPPLAPRSFAPCPPALACLRVWPRARAACRPCAARSSLFAVPPCSSPWRRLLFPAFPAPAPRRSCPCRPRALFSPRPARVSLPPVWWLLFFHPPHRAAPGLRSLAPRPVFRPFAWPAPLGAFSAGSLAWAAFSCFCPSLPLPCACPARCSCPAWLLASLALALCPLCCGPAARGFSLCVPRPPRCFAPSPWPPFPGLACPLGGAALRSVPPFPALRLAPSPLPAVLSGLARTLGFRSCRSPLAPGSGVASVRCACPCSASRRPRLGASLRARPPLRRSWARLRACGPRLCCCPPVWCRAWPLAGVLAAPALFPAPAGWRSRFFLSFWPSWARWLGFSHGGPPRRALCLGHRRRLAAVFPRARIVLPSPGTRLLPPRRSFRDRTRP